MKKLSFNASTAITLAIAAFLIALLTILFFSICIQWYHLTMGGELFGIFECIGMFLWGWN